MGAVLAVVSSHGLTVAQGEARGGIKCAPSCWSRYAAHKQPHSLWRLHFRPWACEYCHQSKAMELQRQRLRADIGRNKGSYARLLRFLCPGRRNWMLRSTSRYLGVSARRCFLATRVRAFVATAPATTASGVIRLISCSLPAPSGSQPIARTSLKTAGNILPSGPASSRARRL